MAVAAAAAGMEAHLIASVQESLALYLHDNAIFLCERLVADFPTEVGTRPPNPTCFAGCTFFVLTHPTSASPRLGVLPTCCLLQVNIFLLATCYHRASQTYRAYHVLRGLVGEQSRYLFALCCMQLGKLTEAEAALMPDNDASRVCACFSQVHLPLPVPARWLTVNQELHVLRSDDCLLAGMQVPNGAAGLYMLGRIYQLSNRHSAAIAYYNTALQRDPMLWSAYEELCVLGADQEAQQYVGAAAAASASASARLFGAGQASTSMPSSSMQSVATPHLAQPAGRTPATQVSAQPSTAAAATRVGLGHAPAWATGARPTAASAARGGIEGTPSPGGAYVTPSPTGRPSGPPPAPKFGGGGGARPAWPATASPLVMSAPPPPSTSGLPGVGGHAAAPQRKFMDEGKLRKVSGKLFVEPASILRRMNDARVEEAAPDEDSVLAVAAVTGPTRGERTSEGQQVALALLHVLAEGYRLLCIYK